MELQSNVFQLPEGTVRKVQADVSVVRESPTGISAVTPILSALRLLGISDRTVAEALGLAPAVVGRWRQGLQVIPYYRQRELRALLELAIKQAEESLTALDRLSETSELALTRSVMAGRIEAARRAL